MAMTFILAILALFGQSPLAAAGVQSVRLEILPAALAAPTVPGIPDGLRVIRLLESAGAGRTNIYEARLGAASVVVKINASPQESLVQHRIHQFPSKAENIRTAGVIGSAPVSEELRRRIDPDSIIDERTWGGYVMKNRRRMHVLVQELLHDGFFGLKDVIPMLEEIPATRTLQPIRPADWAGLEDTVAALHQAGIGMSDRSNYSNIRIRQTGSRTEFALIDFSAGTIDGDQAVIQQDRHDMAQLKRRLQDRGILPR